MKLNSNPMRRTAAPQPSDSEAKTIISQTKKKEFLRDCTGHYFHPTSSMELQTLHQTQNETSQKLHTQRQQQQQTHQQQPRQPQQHYATTGNRYNLDCHSCMLVQMGEKVNKMTYYSARQSARFVS